MSDGPAMDNRKLLLLALNQLQSAIDLMDQGRAPGHIAAHVDLARHQLAEAIGVQTASKRATSNRHERRSPMVR